MLLGPDEPLDRPISEIGRQFLDGTLEFWRLWVRTLLIPFEWQDTVIRSAITLKLCSFAETGAIVAAMTTSIPGTFFIIIIIYLCAITQKSCSGWFKRHQIHHERGITDTVGFEIRSK